jgi:hypothetical protein
MGTIPLKSELIPKMAEASCKDIARVARLVYWYRGAHRRGSTLTFGSVQYRGHGGNYVGDP